MHCAEARGLSAALAFFWAVLFFGIIDLTVVFDQLPDFYESYLLETGWGCSTRGSLPRRSSC